MTYSAASGRDEVRVPVSGNVQLHRQDPAAPHAVKGESGKVGPFGYRRGDHGGEVEGTEVGRSGGYLRSRCSGSRGIIGYTRPARIVALWHAGDLSRRS